MSIACGAGIITNFIVLDITALEKITSRKEKWGGS
jgi:hypothetical protein